VVGDDDLRKDEVPSITCFWMTLAIMFHFSVSGSTYGSLWSLFQTSITGSGRDPDFLQPSIVLRRSGRKCVRFRIVCKYVVATTIMNTMLSFDWYSNSNGAPIFGVVSTRMKQVLPRCWLEVYINAWMLIDSRK
jgi:hypothetical protein